MNFKNLVKYMRFKGKYQKALETYNDVKSPEPWSQKYTEKIENALKTIEEAWSLMPGRIKNKNPSLEMAMNYADLRRIQTELDNLAVPRNQVFNNAILDAELNGIEQQYGIKFPRNPDA